MRRCLQGGDGRAEALATGRARIRLTKRPTRARVSPAPSAVAAAGSTSMVTRTVSGIGVPPGPDPSAGRHAGARRRIGYRTLSLGRWLGLGAGAVPSRLRQVKFLNNIVEQGHRRVKRLTRPELGFGGFWTARRTLVGFEAMAMIRKGQVQNIGDSDIRAQASFIAGLFQIAA
jgi:hypothetical protein